MVDITREHQLATEVHQHVVEVAEIKRRARQWRLADCSVETLVQMRHRLLQEVGSVEAKMAGSDAEFMQHIEGGRPLQAERTRQTIERLANEWEEMDRHLREVDEAIMEQSLRMRLIKLLGSARRVNLLDAAVLLAIAIVVVLITLELLLPLPEEIVLRIWQVDTVISIFLLGEFFLRLSLAEDKRWFVRRYWIDFVSSIPLIPALRIGRLWRFVRFARLIRLLRLGRAARIILFTFRGMDKLGRTFQLNLLKRSALIAVVLLVLGALAISALEGAQVDSPDNLGDSLWWSFTTIVTGGFADLYNPTTGTGRGITVGLILLGLVVTGIFTASLTSVLVGDESDTILQVQRDLEEQIGVVNQKIDLLSRETNEGLIAMETVAQELANQSGVSGISRVLIEAMMSHFECIQASVHLLDEGAGVLRLVSHRGSDEVRPPEAVRLRAGLLGRVIASLLAERDIAAVDIEPETEPTYSVPGIAMVCPLVAGGRVHGALHVVLPDDKGRFYLYNRAPMTLAHQAATALLLFV